MIVLYVSAGAPRLYREVGARERSRATISNFKLFSHSTFSFHRPLQPARSLCSIQLHQACVFGPQTSDRSASSSR